MNTPTPAGQNAATHLRDFAGWWRHTFRRPGYTDDVAAYFKDGQRHLITVSHIESVLAQLDEALETIAALTSDIPILTGTEA